jgi:hypothetical protein
VQRFEASSNDRAADTSRWLAIGLLDRSIATGVTAKNLVFGFGLA